MPDPSSPQRPTPSTPAIRIGLSGWNYPEWRGDFYPRGLAQRRELEFVARLFPTLELNGSFYSLQRPETYRRWYEATPPGFTFAVKGSRYITHMLRLRGIGPALANFFASGVLALEDKLGPVLWQFPPQLAFDPQLIADFTDALPHDTAEALALARGHDARLEGRAHLTVDTPRPLRHAIEVRHASYADPAFAEILGERNVALVAADTASRWPCLECQTANFAYVRLHGDTELYKSAYGDDALADWAARLRSWHRPAGVGPSSMARDVYCYFDNSYHGAAPRDALRLMAMLGQRAEPEGILQEMGRVPVRTRRIQAKDAHRPPVPFARRPRPESR